jgi:hypothetical protein
LRNFLELGFFSQIFTDWMGMNNKDAKTRSETGTQGTKRTQDERHTRKQEREDGRRTNNMITILAEYAAPDGA